jgi:hypothetical protein
MRNVFVDLSSADHGGFFFNFLMNMEYCLPVSTSYHLPAYGWKSNYCVCVVQFSEVVK